MEMKKYSTPRNRVDGELLSRILGEDSGCLCGEYGTPRHSHQVRRQPRGEMIPEMPPVNDSQPCEKCARVNGLTGLSPAMVYAPDQEWHELYCDEEALERGTLFKELDFPLHAGCCSKEGLR